MKNHFHWSQNHWLLNIIIHAHVSMHGFLKLSPVPGHAHTYIMPSNFQGMASHETSKFAVLKFRQFQFLSMQ